MSKAKEPFDVINPVEPEKIAFINGRSKKLAARKDAGFHRGRRKVTLWEESTGESFAVEFKTGAAVTRVRLSKEALEALLDLYDARAGLSWRKVVRVMTQIAVLDADLQTSGQWIAQSSEEQPNSPSEASAATAGLDEQ